MSDGSDMAKWIDAAHKLYRDAIGTPNEQSALDAFRGVVKYAQDVRDGKRTPRALTDFIEVSP